MRLKKLLAGLGVLAAFSAYGAAGDFDGSGTTDLLWRNSATGENYLYPMNGTVIGPGEGFLRTVADSNWQIAAVGDFDGNGLADVLWRNKATGENYIYFMNGTSIVAEGYIRSVADQAWQVVGAGRFNGGTNDGILWRNQVTGENYIYLMSGLAITGEGYLRTVADLAWQVVGVGDFDGDAKDDILWRNTTTGENYIYPMDGIAIKATEGFIRTVADQAWQVAGVGKIDAGATADIVWRNRQTGENYLYFMAGTTISNEGYLRTVADQHWQIEAIGDIDGSGTADLFWRNSATGENYLYPLDGATILPSEGYVRQVPDQQWRIASIPAQQKLSGDFGARTPCDSGLASNDPNAASYAKSIDLCNTASPYPPFRDQRWGVISAQLLLPDGTGTPATEARSIRPAFGAGGNDPRFGSAMAVLSTGAAAAPGQTNPSHVHFEQALDHETVSEFPPDWYAARGGTLPNAPGCPSPEGAVAEDPVMLQVRMRVPTNARSFSFSTRFFSSEYPEWVCSPFNDMYVVLLDSGFSGQPANPSDKNLAQYQSAGGAIPLGVNLAQGNSGLFSACQNGNTGCEFGATPGTYSVCSGTADLMGTGFDEPTPGVCDLNSLLGGGTAWLSVRGNVVPGEEIVLRFAIWDTSDGLYDSLVLIDNFAWSDQVTTPGAFLPD
jgi:hypothetical protein